MTKLARMMVVVAALGACLCVPAMAQAQSPYGAWYASPYPADLSSLYRTGRIPAPPYFAMHPPVYYSYAVPRTYGYSPWAYMPHVRTPDVEACEPQVIENQFVPKATRDAVKQQAPLEQTVSAPQVIENPFVTVSLDATDPVL